MAVTFVDLVARLEEDVPAVGGVPSPTQYERAVKEAVSAFSRKAGMLKRATLNVVANTAAYTLPADFLKAARMDGILSNGDTVSQPGGKLLPLGVSTQQERYTIAGRTLTFYPTPSYTLDRFLWYKAGYVLVDGEYADMGDDVADIVMLKARSAALRFLANAKVPDGWKYQYGDVMVDKSNQASGLSNLAKSLDDEFDKQVADFIGPLGVSSRYDLAERAAYDT